MEAFIAALKSLWLLWLFALFVGIVAWAYAPKRRRRLQSHGSIPLRDED
ncbi:MAG: cbb3-type cytochrome c oxidase subunit 3 [Alphaproteobacteria bacterium]